MLHSLARRVASYLKIECYLISNIASVGLNFLRVRLVKVNREYIYIADHVFLLHVDNLILENYVSYSF